MTAAHLPEPQFHIAPDPRRFVHMPVGLLTIDHRAQRRVREANVAKIIAAFDWLRFECLTITEDLHVVEGQHRTLALQQIDPECRVPCMVVPGMSSDSAKAALGLGISKGRKPTPALDEWEQRVMSRERHEVLATKELEARGLHVASSASSKGIGCVAALRTLIHPCSPEEGARLLGETLDVLATAFPTADSESSTYRWEGNLLKTIFGVIKKNPKIDLTRLTKCTSVRPAIQWVNYGLGGAVSPHIAIGGLLAREYNRNLRESSRIKW